MNRTIAALLISISIAGCNTPVKEGDQLKITDRYFDALNHSDHSKLKTWLADSIITIEGNYEQTISRDDYQELLKWDAVFSPTYQILKIELHGESVKAKVNKLDKRIEFLHEKPFITQQTIRFQNNQITNIKIEYVNFDEPLWSKNKKDLLDWIDSNHPELNGFIYDQTEIGGRQFLEAIELFKNKN